MTPPPSVIPSSLSAVNSRSAYKGYFAIRREQESGAGKRNALKQQQQARHVGAFIGPHQDSEH